MLERSVSLGTKLYHLRLLSGRRGAEGGPGSGIISLPGKSPSFALSHTYVTSNGKTFCSICRVSKLFATKNDSVDTCDTLSKKSYMPVRFIIPSCKTASSFCFKIQSQISSRQCFDLRLCCSEFNMHSKYSWDYSDAY